jgi:hypothetical protein
VHHRFAILTSLLISLFLSIACSKKPGLPDESSDSGAPHSSSSLFGKKEMTIPAGTVITVRLANAVGSNISNSGDKFHASVATPVEVDGKVVVPSGAEASGEVLQAVPQGRFQGAAVLNWRSIPSPSMTMPTMCRQAQSAATSKAKASAPQP